MVELLVSTPGIDNDENGGLHFADWNCRAGQNNVIIRTDGTVAPCFPMYSSTFDWCNIERPRFDPKQLNILKNTCQRHCFSTLNHTLGHRYDDARVISWLWKQAKNGFQGGEKLRRLAVFRKEPRSSIAPAMPVSASRIRLTASALDIILPRPEARSFSAGDVGDFSDITAFLRLSR